VKSGSTSSAKNGKQPAVRLPPSAELWREIISFLIFLSPISILRSNPRLCFDISLSFWDSDVQLWFNFCCLWQFLRSLHCNQIEIYGRSRFSKKSKPLGQKKFQEGPIQIDRDLIWLRSSNVSGKVQSWISQFDKDCRRMKGLLHLSYHLPNAKKGEKFAFRTQSPIRFASAVRIHRIENWVRFQQFFSEANGKTTAMFSSAQQKVGKSENFSCAMNLRGFIESFHPLIKKTVSYFGDGIFGYYKCFRLLLVFEYPRFASIRPSRTIGWEWSSRWVFLLISIEKHWKLLNLVQSDPGIDCFSSGQGDIPKPAWPRDLEI
jgi:hypothetical protein